MRDQDTCTNDELFSRTERNGVWDGVMKDRGLCIQSLENVKKACDDAIEDLKFRNGSLRKRPFGANTRRSRRQEGLQLPRSISKYERLGMLPSVQGAS